MALTIRTDRDAWVERVLGVRPPDSPTDASNSSSCDPKQLAALNTRWRQAVASVIPTIQELRKYTEQVAAEAQPPADVSKVLAVIDGVMKRYDKDLFRSSAAMDAEDAAATAAMMLSRIQTDPAITRIDGNPTISIGMRASLSNALSDVSELLGPPK
jgi:hypothetical protein